MVSRCRRRLGAGSSRTTCSAVYRHETQGGDASHQSGTKLSRAARLTDQHEPWVRALLASPWVAQVLMLLSNNNNKLTSLHLTVARRLRPHVVPFCRRGRVGFVAPARPSLVECGGENLVPFLPKLNKLSSLHHGVVFPRRLVTAAVAAVHGVSV